MSADALRDSKRFQRDVETALAAIAEVSPAQTAALAKQVIAQLRELAVGDPKVLALLDAMRDEEAYTRAEQMEATGMDTRTHAAASRRLAALREHLARSRPSARDM